MTVTHPSTNRARHRVTSFMQRMMLDTMPRHQLYPHLIRCSLGPPDSASQMASWSVQRFFAQLMAESPCTFQWAPLSPKLPLPIGDLDPHQLNMIPWAYPSPQPKQHLDQFRNFCTDNNRVSLYFTMGHPFPPQNCHFPWGKWTPSNIWFLGPTKFSTQTASWSVQLFFAGLTSVTDRQTDHATRSVTIGRIYVSSTAMWPNNTA